MSRWEAKHKGRGQGPQGSGGTASRIDQKERELAMANNTSSSTSDATSEGNCRASMVKGTLVPYHKLQALSITLVKLNKNNYVEWSLKKSFPKKNIPPAPPKHAFLRINSSRLLLEEVTLKPITSYGSTTTITTTTRKRRREKERKKEEVLAAAASALVVAVGDEPPRSSCGVGEGGDRQRGGGWEGRRGQARLGWGGLRIQLSVCAVSIPP
ncbi:hypothetical protein Taro_014201 [Colocasia esculenta]|uniref:Uncharacterized protein n=1 Tax=Colocasia esculenta TaxID=4460 RepID=A0A843UE21_COLES|nr:hypothetical protein [Colocasia esculenta]